MIKGVLLDKFLHENKEEISTKLIEKFETLAEAETISGSINSKISALNGAWKIFYEGVKLRPDNATLQGYADGVNDAFKGVIDAISGLKDSWNSLGNIPETNNPSVAFSQMLDDLKTAFTDAQPQYYFTMLSRIYHIQAEEERLNFVNKYNEKFSDPDKGPIAEAVGEAIQDLVTNYGQGETLLKYFLSSTSTTIGSDILVKNISTLSNDIQNRGVANFSVFDEVNARFKALNKLLWNVLNKQDNSAEMQTAMDAFLGVEGIPADLTENLAVEGTSAESATNIYEGLKALYRVYNRPLRISVTGEFWTKFLRLK
jgi:hypothetical protein